MNELTVKRLKGALEGLNDDDIVEAFGGGDRFMVMSLGRKKTVLENIKNPSEKWGNGFLSGYCVGASVAIAAFVAEMILWGLFKPC